MRRCPDPGIAIGQLGTLLQRSDEFLERIAGNLLAADQHDRCRRHDSDRLEILQRVDWRVRIERRRKAHGAHRSHQERVAIRRRAGGACGTGGAGRSSYVLDDHPLPERRREAFGDDAGDDVGRPAGPERHDDGDRLAGEGLRVRLVRENRQSKCGAGDEMKDHDAFL
jgi:hypothetical protein